MNIDLDGNNIATVVDFYKILLDKIGAPDWHGYSVDALIDSIVYGNINDIEAPFSILIHNSKNIPTHVLSEIKVDIGDLICVGNAERKDLLSVEYL